MKFLTIATYKDTYSSLPAEEKQKMGLADIEYVLEHKQKVGDKWTFYQIPGWNRMVSIGEYDSIEEYYQSLQGPSTQAGYSNIESYPLIEMDVEQWKAAVAQAKAAK